MEPPLSVEAILDVVKPCPPNDSSPVVLSAEEREEGESRLRKKLNLYELLQLAPTTLAPSDGGAPPDYGGVTEQQIQKQFRQRSRFFHSDKTSDPRAAVVFSLLQEAAEILKDSSLRAEYDASLARKGDVAAAAAALSSKLAAMKSKLDKEERRAREAGGEPLSSGVTAEQRKRQREIEAMEHANREEEIAARVREAKRRTGGILGSSLARGAGAAGDRVDICDGVVEYSSDLHIRFGDVGFDGLKAALNKARFDVGLEPMYF